MLGKFGTCQSFMNNAPTTLLDLVLLHSTSLVSGGETASALNTILITPELIASKQYYTGATSFLNGGVANIVSWPSVAVSGASIFSQYSPNRVSLPIFQIHKNFLLSILSPRWPMSDNQKGRRYNSCGSERREDRLIPEYFDGVFRR